MRKIALLLVLALSLNGCYWFVAPGIRESAAMDYAVVTAAVAKIEDGSMEPADAAEILKLLLPSMHARVAYFEGRKPEEE